MIIKIASIIFFIMFFSELSANTPVKGETAVLNSNVENEFKQKESEMSEEDIKETGKNLEQIKKMMVRIDSVILETDTLLEKLESVFSDNADSRIACMVKANMKRQRDKVLNQFNKEKDKKAKEKLKRIYNSYNLAFKKATEKSKNIICME